MRRDLFLYLAIACFIGLIAVFIGDGYIGVHDTVYITADEYTQEISPDFWQRQRQPYPYSIGARWDDSVHFRYQIENHRFSIYSATVEASVWKSNVKVADLFREDIMISGLDSEDMEWTLSSQELARAGMEIGQYTVKIKRGDTELGQGIIIGFYSPAEIYPQMVPLPPR